MTSLLFLLYRFLGVNTTSKDESIFYFNNSPQKKKNKNVCRHSHTLHYKIMDSHTLIML